MLIIRVILSTFVERIEILGGDSDDSGQESPVTVYDVMGNHDLSWVVPSPQRRTAIRRHGKWQPYRLSRRAPKLL